MNNKKRKREETKQGTNYNDHNPQREMRRKSETKINGGEELSGHSPC